MSTTTRIPAAHLNGKAEAQSSAPRARANDRRIRPWRDRQSFVYEFARLPLESWEALAETASPGDIAPALATGERGPREAAALISEAAAERLDEIERAARDATLKRFGRTVQLFAPLYLSNECVNTCLYCGFSLKNEIPRKTLTLEEVDCESAALASRGFRHQLLVSAEHPKLVPADYLAECVRTANVHAPYVQLEVQAQDEPTYGSLRNAGVDGVVIYQETYDREAYARLHKYGMKKDIDFRLDAPDRIGRARIKQVGLGVLLGLTERWRRDVIALAAHVQYMQRRYWRTQVTVSLPRLRPAAGGFKGPTEVTDSDFVQAICALRLVLPEAGIVLSTREPERLRDALIGVGVTHMSAGSSTEPGGYEHPGEAAEQFSIDDERPPAAVAESIAAHGYEPVWKDWEQGI